jgi:hypothetical protein
VAYINSRLDTLQAATNSNINVIVNDKAAQKPWWDYVVDFGGDVIGELADDMFRRWFDGNSWKDVLADKLKDLVGSGADGTEASSNVIPVFQPDFRLLKNNAFATDKNTSGAVYGLGVAQDISFSPSARICTVPTGEIAIDTNYGEAWAGSMTSFKKVPIIDFGTLSASLCNVNVKTLVASSNVSMSNVTCSNAAVTSATMNSLQIPSTLVATGGTVSLNAVQASNYTSSGNATVGSLSFGTGSLYGGVSSTGDITAASVDINGGAFKVFGNGSVSMNGTFIADGANKRLIVYDDQILPRTQRYRVQDVLSGNLGTTDDDFFFATPPLALQANPLSFTALATEAKRAALQITGHIPPNPLFDHMQP